MAAPVIASVATQLPPGFGNANITFNKPASTVAGDLLIAHIVVKFGTACTPPSGWTQLDKTISGNVLDALYYRVADGTEGSTFAFSVTTSSLDRSVGAIVRITGADGTTPVNAHSQTAYNGDHASADSPSITTTVADCLILLTNGQAAHAGTNTLPSGATSDWDATNTNAATTTGGDKTAALAGTTGVYTWSVTSFAGDFVLRTTALGPSGGGGGGLIPQYYYRSLVGGIGGPF